MTAIIFVGNVDSYTTYNFIALKPYVRATKNTSTDLEEVSPSQVIACETLWRQEKSLFRIRV